MPFNIRICFLVAVSGLTGLTALAQPESRIVKPRIADTVRLNVFADNWFKLYINGELIATDSIAFMPHNVISVEVLPEYPMTIAVMARDNADAITGKEYNHTQIGDGGFILKLGDEVVTDKTWKAKCYFFGPLTGQNEAVKHLTIPANWHAVEFDDSDWDHATEHAASRVRPPRVFGDYDFAGAKFIWTEDLDLHNTIIFRTTIERPDWKPRWNTGAPARRIEDIKR
ncbi:MAG: hypothetical protein SynsKO_00780 [Synoicihabitans sp.]